MGAVGSRERYTKEETEALRRRIWLFKSRGLSISQIAKAVQRSPSTVSHHLRKAREESMDWYQGAGEKEIAGEMLMNHRELRQEALRNMARTDPGSRQRMQWLQEARNCLKAETSFMLDLGVLSKQPQRIDVSMLDVRKMSGDEIARQIAQLQKELALARVRGVNAPDGGEDVIDVEARVHPTVQHLSLGSEDDEEFQEPDEVVPEDDEYEDYDPFNE